MSSPTAHAPSPPAAEAIPVTPRAILNRQMMLVGAVLLLAAWVAWEFIVPLAWAGVLAITEWPLYRRLLRRYPNHPAWLATGFALATAMIVLVPLSIAGMALAQESQAALDWLKHAQQSGIAAPSWLAALPLVGARAATYWQQHLGSPKAANTLLGSIRATSVLDWTKSIGGTVARELGLLLITLIALTALLSRGEAIRARSGTVATHLFGEFGDHFLDRMIGAVRGTVNGTVLVSFGEGAIIGVGYMVVGVPQALLFTTFTILLALVPFGAWLAFGVASLIVLGLGHAIAALALFVFGAVVMTVGDNVVQPSVIGSAVELPFLLAMIGAFGGLAEMGLVGLFVGPVIMAALLLIWRQWIRPVAEGGEPVVEAG